MEKAPQSDDDQWLGALAGRTDSNGDANTNLQSQALRRALQVRAEKLETNVPFADEGQYQKLLLRLQREKLLAPKSGWRTSPIWEKTTGALGLSPDVIPWKSPVMWGLTATFLIGAAVVMSLQNSVPSKSDEDILRGGKVTAQIVEEPELRLNQLIQGLRAAGEEPVIERVSSGSIILTVTSSPRVLDYLDTQRIIPSVVEGKITLLLMRPKAATKQK